MIVRRLKITPCLEAIQKLCKFSYIMMRSNWSIHWAVKQENIKLVCLYRFSEFYMFSNVNDPS